MDALEEGSRARRRARVLTLGIGFALIAACVAATLSHAVERRTGTNQLPAREYLQPPAFAADTICQSSELVPAGTAALRFRAYATSHAPLRLTLTLAGDSGQDVGTAARWEGDDAIVVPLAHVLRHETVADVCIALHRSNPTQLVLRGVPTGPGEGATRNGDLLGGRMHFDYLAARRASWWSQLPTLVRRLGRGHAWSGPSVALLAALLMLAPIALSAWQLTRDDR